MKNCTKWFTVLLTVCLLFAAAVLVSTTTENLLLPLQAKALTEGNYTYTVSNGEATITDFSDSYSGNVTIPSTLGGYPVTTIGDSAFADCAFSTITISDSVKTIEVLAFTGCTSLTSIVISDSVETIMQPSFYNCLKLENITVSLDNQYYCDVNGVLFDKNKTVLVRYPAAKTDLSYAIPDSVKTIGNQSFTECRNLTYLTIPDSVEEIGYYAFYKSQVIKGVYIFDIVKWCNIDFSIYHFLFDCVENLYLNGELVTDLVLPEGIERINSFAFQDYENLTSILIPDSVTMIGDGAFKETTWYDNQPNGLIYAGKVLYTYKGSMPSNTSITIKDGTKGIADEAFSGFSMLSSITIPASVEKIGEKAFSNCDSLASVIFGDNSKLSMLGYETFYDCDNLASVIFGNNSKLTSISDSVFFSCNSLASITIPASVTNIGSCAFHSCTSLASIYIPDRVTNIGEFAFFSCASLASITIPDSVTSIGEFAFNGCTSLASITIPNSVTSIGDNAFAYCNSLKSVTFEANIRLQSIGDYAFYSCDSLASVNFGDNCQLTSLGDQPFYFCNKLESVTFGANCHIQRINEEAFAQCYNLASVTFGENCQLQSIGYDAFYGCTSLASIYIPDSVTSIGSRAFYRCTSLASVDFGDNSHLTSIGSEAFYSCASLASITIPDSVTSIGSRAFSDCTSLASITIPDSVTSIGSSAFSDCTSLASVYFNGDVADWCSIAFGYDAQPLINGADLYLNGTLVTDLIIPEGVTSIGKYAFYNCDSLTSITIPDSVTSIGNSAFRYCDSLASVYFDGDVADWCNIAFEDGCSNPLCCGAYLYLNGTFSIYLTIPDGVISIGDYAFYGYSPLKNITIPDSVTSIGSGAFSDCTSLASITIPDSVTSIGSGAFYRCTSLASITIPNSVTSIGNSAFRYCDSLASVDFGENSQLTSIGYCAFYDCDSLASITIPDSVTTIGTSAFHDCSALTEITLPFVGLSRDAAGTADGVFGSIFGYTTSSVSTATQQYYASGKTAYYYIPSSLKKVVITNADLIPYGAFYGCSMLTSVTINNSIETIEKNAFYGCSALTKITLPFVGCSRDAAGTADGVFGSIFGYTTSSVSTATQQYYASGKSAYYYIPSSLKKVVITNTDSLPYGAFFNCKNLTSITLPDCLVQIGAESFYYCTGLASLTIPESVTTIEMAAFYYCSDLTAINIPSAVTAIGGNAFYACSSLDEIHIEDVAAWCNISYGNMYSHPNYYAEKLYLNGELLTDLVVPEGVTAIKDYGFYNCKKLNSVSIPSTVTAIGNYAFSGCSGLAEISMNEGVQTIGNFAFYNCKALIGVSVPASVTSIGNNAFYNCSSLEHVLLSENLNSVGSSAFYACSKLGNAYFFGNAPASFGSNVFKNTKSDFGIYVFDLAEETGWTQPTWNGYNVYLSNSADLVTKTLDADNKDSAGVKYIVNPATMTAKVSGYEGTATEVTVPCAVKKDGVKYTVTAVDYEAFRNKGLTQVLLPYTIESIGAYAFAENPGLTEFDIRYKTASLGNGAFMGCTGLARVNLNHVLTAIGKNTFKNCSSLKGIVLGSKITTIGESAFYNCTQLSAVNLENITEIGKQAFYNCDKLKQLTLSRNILSIGDAAFADCQQLVGAHFTGNHPQTVGADIFGDTANDKFYVFYPPEHASWQGKVTDARWHDYQAVPFNAVTQLAIEKDKMQFYFFCISDVHGEPIECATVTLDGISATTYADGYAYLPTPEELTVPLKITKLGYNPIELDYTIEAVPLAFYTLTEDPSTVTPLSCNGININTGVAQINAAAELTAEIVVSGYSQFPIESYNIMQNGNVIKSSTSSTIKIENKLFIPGADVYVAMHTADGKTVTEKLNIVVINQNGCVVGDEIKEYGFAFTIDECVPNFGGTTVIAAQNKAPKITYSVSNEKLVVGIGIDLDIDDNLTDAQRLLKKGLEKFSPYYLGIYSDLSFMGYIFADLVGDEIVITDQDVKMIVSFKLLGKTKFIAGLDFEMEASGNGEYNVKFAMNEKNQLAFQELIADIHAQCKISLEKGSFVFKYGVYGSAEVIERYKYFPEPVHYKTTERGTLGIWYKFIFCKKREIPVIVGETTVIYCEEPGFAGGGGGGGGSIWSLRVGASADSENLYLIASDPTDLAGYEHITREYLNTRSSWYPSGIKRVGVSAQATADVTASAQLLQSSAYSGIDPQIITCNDTTMMVYLDDDEELDDNNYQKLVYSIYSEEGKIWSEPVNISEDSRFEDYPSVAADDRFIYVAYTKANREMTDEDKGDETEEGIAHGLTTYASVMETVVSVYDTETGTLVEEVYLTENEHLDIRPVVKVMNGIPTVCWIDNTANDIFLSEGTNNLYKSQLIDGKWETSLVLTDCGLVTSLDAGMLNGKAYIALCVDEDNELLTEGDGNIYLVDENSEISCLTEQAGAYSMPTFASFEGVDQLVWYQNGNLCYITAPDGEISTILETPSDKLSPHFKLIENNGRYDILFSANNDSETDEEGNLLDPGSDIYGIFYDNGWGNPIKITDAGNSYYINAFDAYYKDDELLIPYLRTLVTFYEDGSGYSEECDFYSTRVEFNGNITVSDPGFADTDLFDDDKLTVYLNINNSMHRKINGLRFTVTAPDGSKVDTVTTDSVILSGANEDVEFTFTLPDEITEGAYTITAVPLNGSDADESDNSVSLCLLHPDLVVLAKQTIIGTKTYIHASVENLGNAAADGTLNIYVNHAEKAIHSLAFTSIAPGEKQLFEITTDASFFEGDANTSVVCISAENENDINTNNNKEYISLFDPAEEEIDLETVAKQSSVYPLYISYDKYKAEVTPVELNANTNSFEGIENVDNAAYTLADNKLTFNTAYLNSLAEGEQTFLFTFRDKNNDLQKISVAVYISDTTPEEITGEISIDGNAKVNGILSVNTANLSENTAVFTCQWYSDGSAIQGATQSTYAVRSADVGKSISVTITASGNYAGTFTSPSIAITCEHVFKNWITLTPATCTTDGTQKGSCVCGATSQRDVTAPGHAWSTTCTSNGDGENNTHYQTCTRTGCDATSDAVAHTWNEGVVAPDPTCEDAGIRTFTCTASGCGATFTEAVDANGHSYGEWIAEIPATCIATGTRGHYDCADCDKHFDADKAEIADLTIAINSANHVHTTEHEQQAATCTDIGYTASVWCVDCARYISGHEEIPALAHRNKVHHEAVAATCSAEGSIEYWSCPDCSKNFSDEACTTEATDLTVAINSEAHKWDEGIVTTEPGCITEGVKTYTCQHNSEHTYTESVSATNHKFDVHTPANAATCVKGGNKAYKLCSNCKLYFAEDAAFDSNAGQTSAEAFATEINPDNHAIVNNEAQAPTCTEIGWDAYVTCQCEGCNYTTYVEKAANGHAYDLTKGVAAEAGKHTVTCPNCAEGTEGHTKVVDCTYGEGVVSAPTCTKNGYTTHTCTACGYSYTDNATEKLGHKFSDWAAIGNDQHARNCTVCTDEEGRVETADCSYGEWKVNTEPGCETTGGKEHTCSVCNNTVTAEVAALGHAYGDADCLNPATCTRCGATTGEALGHDFTVFVETVDYTCTEKGYDIYKCSRCDATENKNYTDAACRPEKDYTVTVKATCEADGEKSIFCSACDKALVTTVIEKRAHVYKDNGVKTSATCVAEGVMNTICTNEETAEYAACAHESTRVIPVDKDAHKWETEYTVDKKASCNAAGTKSYLCEYCDAINADSVVEIAKREHNLVDTTVALAPTCSATGIMNQKCDCAETAEYEACDYTTTRVMDKVADAHKAEAEYIQTVAPTCSAVGEEKLYCEYCDAVLDTREVAIDADAHKWETEYTVDKKASCDAAGSKSYHCEYCDAINADSVVEIAKREHNLVDTTVALAPTCSATGTMNQKCDCAETAEYEACDYTTTRVMDKVADAHKAEAEHIQTVAPTCSAVGEEKLYCEYCDAVLDTREVAIDADAHKWETEYTVDKKASCDAAGSKSYHCEYCDTINADSVVEIAKREHNLVDTTVAKAPTCSATGIMNQQCDNVGSDEYEACTYTTTREIPVPGHSWGEWTVSIPATYIQEGEEIRTCNECGTTETHTLDKLPLPDSIVIAEPYTTVKVSDGFVVTSVNKTVADLLAVSNATNVLTATGENADAATVLATGMQLVITDGETVVSCMEIVILGDVDGDGIIAAADARMALRASVGLDVLNTAQQKAADTDTNNTIAASDAREILRASVGLDDPVVWFEKIRNAL